jgi:hypothetical protein
LAVREAPLEVLFRAAKTLLNTPTYRRYSPPDIMSDLRRRVGANLALYTVQQHLIETDRVYEQLHTKLTKRKEAEVMYDDPEWAENYTQELLHGHHRQINCDTILAQFLKMMTDRWRERLTHYGGK